MLTLNRPTEIKLVSIWSNLFVLCTCSVALAESTWTDAQGMACLDVLKNCLEDSPQQPWKQLCDAWGDPAAFDAKDDLLEWRKVQHQRMTKQTACASLVGILDLCLPKPYAPPPDNASPALILTPDRVNNTDASAGGFLSADPVSGVETVSLAGGAVSFVGSRDGSDAVVAMSVNPLAVANGATGDKESFIRAQRTFDGSVAVPIADLGAGNPTVGGASVRIRGNFAPLMKSKEVKKLASASRNYDKEMSRFEFSLETLLKSVQKIEPCVRSLLEGETTRCTRTDGTSAPAFTGLGLDQRQKAEESLMTAMRDLRRDLDRYYFGLDLRGDFGDLTGDSVLNDAGYTLNCALAFGIRMASWSSGGLELRLRGGFDYQSFTDPAEGIEEGAATMSAEWGAGLSASWMLNDQDPKSKKYLGFGIGALGRHTSEAGLKGETASAMTPVDPTLAADTNFIELRFSAMFPAANGTMLGITVAKPFCVSPQADECIHGEDVRFAITGDLALLASAAK